MKFGYETEEEKLKNSLKIGAEKRLERLLAMLEFNKHLPKKVKDIQKHLRELENRDIK